MQREMEKAKKELEKKIIEEEGKADIDKQIIKVRTVTDKNFNVKIEGKKIT